MIDTHQEFASDHFSQEPDEPRKISFTSFPVLVLLILSALFNLASYGIIFFFIGERNAPIVLHYNVYFGIDVIGDWWEAYLVPLVGTLFYGVHFVLGKYLFFLREQALALAVLAGLFFLECMIGIASITLVLANY